jgi:hypothetical protein
MFAIFLLVFFRFTYFYHWLFRYAKKGEKTEYIFYCKRAILFLSSSKILTPPSPSPPGECVPPPLLRGEEIGLPSYSNICTLREVLYSVKLYCIQHTQRGRGPRAMFSLNRQTHRDTYIEQQQTEKLET